jgi:phospholipid/cholesterol/gamma-HCH transport system substrate-binding protein
MQASGKLELRVGIFVSLALLFGGVMVFLIGNRSSMFQSKRNYVAIFEEVSGLRGGSPVRIAGIDVGTVTEIEFNDDGLCVAHIAVREDMVGLVHSDSRASIGSKGLLGDQLINISVGHEGQPLREGAEIQVETPSALTAFLGDTGTDAQASMANVREFTNVLAEEGVQEDIRRIIHNLAELTALAQEDGTVRRLLTDPEMANRVNQALADLGQASSELSRTARGIRQISDEVRTGDGTAHALIYGRDGVRLVGSLADTAGEAATILRDVRTGDNNAHAILYGDDAGNLIQNLTEASADIRAITAEVRAGRGTIGGLLVDPSIYEDVKRLVGNLQRNEILRSLVRYSIREDEARGRPIVRPRGEGEGGAESGQESGQESSGEASSAGAP